jgi:hypothetical protein
VREQDFRQYLLQRYSNESTALTVLSDMRAAERRLGSDIEDYLADDPGRPLPDDFKNWERGAVNRYREFLTDFADEDEPTDEVDEKTLMETDRFSLEVDLQRALRGNLAQLAPSLTVADDGSERAVATGRIDILARDSRGVWWVIELKAGTASDRAVSQLAAYMGALVEEEEGEVRGLLVARDFTDKARYAARAIPGIELKRYGFSFTFEDHA